MLLAHLPPGLTLWFLWHRWYRLELDRREDYEVCKVLVALAMAEEGECWKDEAFRPSELAQWVADWELPKSWGESGVDENTEAGKASKNYPDPIRLGDTNATDFAAMAA